MWLVTKFAISIISNNGLSMKSINKSIAVLLVVGIILSTTACSDMNNQNKMATENSTSIFPKGEKLTNGYFTGDAYLKLLLPGDKNNDFVIGNVTFEPGARTNWHTHPKGQVLIVTEGNGFYQEKGNLLRH